MPRFALEVKFNSEQLSQISPCQERFCWMLKLKCASCGEQTDNWHDISEQETFAISGSRGEANFVHRCKQCGQRNNLNIVPGSVKAYDCLADDDWQRIVIFDCRGVVPVDFSPNVDWTAVSSVSNTVFDPVTIDCNEWADYDENGASQVCIENVQHRFVKL